MASAKKRKPGRRGGRLIEFFTGRVVIFGLISFGLLTALPAIQFGAESRNH
jgi:hypothetical protein